MNDVAVTMKTGLSQKILMAVSFLLALPLAGVLMINPALMLDAHGHYSHPALMLIMLGISGGFVYGVGFTAQFWLWKWLFHPVVSFPLMLWGYYIWLLT